MKNWQILALCFSIIISVIAAAFYIKYEPKTLIESDYGSVDLGRVFSERVMVDIILIDYSGGEEGFVVGASFRNTSTPIFNSLVKLNDHRNSTVAEKYQSKYDDLNAYRADKTKLKIRTYITYSSSNFMNIPYTLVIGEETYLLEAYAPLKKSIYKIVDKNLKAKKDNVLDHLFITDRTAYGLEESVSE